MSEDHWLYRVFDENKELLYIGITSDGPKRFRRHGNDREWWPEVRHIEVEHFASRDEVRRAEQDAIETEHPRHNKALKRSDLPPRNVIPMYPICRDCGRERRFGEECPCSPMEREEARGIILEMWNQGASAESIGESIDWPVKRVRREVSAMRAKGAQLVRRGAKRVSS